MFIQLGQRIPLIPWLLISFFAMSIQLVLGTDFLIVLMAFSSLMLSLLILNYKGIYDLFSMMGFIICVKYTVVPIVYKTFVLERIDRGLWAPFETFTIIFLDQIMIILAIITIDFIKIVNPILKPLASTRDLERSAIIFFTIGFGASILHTIFVPVNYGYTHTEGFGGFGLIKPLTYLGIVFATYANLIISDGRHALNKINALLLILMFMESLLSNTKHEFVTSILAFILTIMYYKRGIWSSYLLWGLFVGLLFVNIVTPIVQFTRTPQFKTADISEKIDILSDVVPRVLNPSTYAEIADPITAKENKQFRYFPTNILVDRLEMIQDMDLIVSKAKMGHFLGWSLLLEDFKKILPGFLVTKDEYSDVDVISFHYGTRPSGLIGFPTVGLFATAFAMFGWFGGCILTYLVILMNFLVIKFIAGSSLYKNEWTIFLMIELWLGFSERSVGQLIVEMLRGLPILVIVILFVMRFLKVSSKTNHRLNHYS